MNNSKIGFACKYIDFPSQVNGVKATDDCKKYNTSTTTMTWLTKQAQHVAEERLWDLMKHNIQSIKCLVSKVSTLDPQLRMVRLSSDILPAYTHKDWKYFWKKPDVIKYAETMFEVVGNIAKLNNVRLSMHPGQFCCIVSDKPDVVTSSLEELEYHTDMIKWLGYGKSKLDFKLNVHLSGKQGVNGFESVWNRMSPELRNCLTIENDEYQSGLDSVLQISDKVGIVLDVHHHFINTGEYILETDPRIEQIINSWQGIRPVMHYSVSREDYLDKFCLPDQLPNLAELNKSGVKSSYLRAHSDFMWNTATNDWAYQHTKWADIMVECKSKNLGATALFESWKLKNTL